MGELRSFETNGVSLGQQMPMVALAVSLKNLTSSFGQGSREKQDTHLERLSKKDEVAVRKIHQANWDLVCLSE